MERDAIWSTVTETFRETLGRGDLTLERDTSARDVPEWDSVTHIQLLVALEDAFDIEFQTGEIAGLANVGELVDLIADRLGSSR